MNYNKRATYSVEREQNMISINHLSSAICVSDFIRVMKDGTNKGWRNFELDFSNVNSVFPNAATPIAGLISYFQQNGIEFEINDRKTPSNVAVTGILKPYDISNNEAVLRRNALNKVWKFFGSNDVQKIVESYLIELRKEERFEKGVLNAIEWSIYETMDNVIQHAKIDHGYVMGQLHTSTKNVVFTIYDLGQGIYNSLRNSVHNPKSTIDALTLCIQEEVTRDKSIGQGNGLFGLFSIIKQGNGRLMLTSGNALYKYDQGQVSTNERIPFLSNTNVGTTVDFQLNYAGGLSLEKALVFRGVPYEMVDLYIEGLEDGDGYIRYKISDHAEGTGTRESAIRVKNEVFNIIKESHKVVVLDFSGVSTNSSSFADELIAKMLIEMGLFQFNRTIRLEGMDKSMQLILQRSVLQRIIEDYGK